MKRIRTQALKAWRSTGRFAHQLYVRIGGVHALVHVMRDSAGHHNDVIEVLTEFIRGRRSLWTPPGR